MSDELLLIDDLDSKLIEVQDYFELFSNSHIELVWQSEDLKQIYFSVDDFDSYI